MNKIALLPLSTIPVAEIVVFARQIDQLLRDLWGEARLSVGSDSISDRRRNGTPSSDSLESIPERMKRPQFRNPDR